MDAGMLSILGIGFLLGVKHAIEPDHIIAVTTIASRSKKLWRSSLAGVFWGIGHTATLFIVGLILILMKNSISDKWALSLEFLVGIMLVYLGMSNLGFFKRQKKDIHSHAASHGERHRDLSYVKSLFIGLVHGLAGSAAMVLLTMSTVDTLWEGAEYIIFFGAGTMIGMLVFTTIIGIPFVLSSNNPSLNTMFTRLTGAISSVFGLFYMYDLGVTEKLFQLWLQ